MNKAVKISDEIYKQVKWLSKEENRTIKAIIGLSIVDRMGKRYEKYVKDRKK